MSVVELQPILCSNGFFSKFEPRHRYPKRRVTQVVQLMFTARVMDSICDEAVIKGTRNHITEQCQSVSMDTIRMQCNDGAHCQGPLSSLTHVFITPCYLPATFLTLHISVSSPSMTSPAKRKWNKFVDVFTFLKKERL